MNPDIKYEADWSRSGLFDHPLSDISGYVLSSSWRRGRPGPPPAYDTAGTATISLDNSSSIFSSFNAQSPLYGLVLPNVRIRISMRKPSSSEWRVKFTGDLENVTPNVGESVGTSTVLFSVVGLFARWSSGEAQVPLQENITTGAAINALLDNDSFPAEARDIDAGQTTLSKWWAKLGSKRLDAIRQLQNAEFGRAREGEAGDFKWEDRAHIFAAPHDVPQATFGTGGLFMWDIQQQEPLSGIYNHARGEVKTFNVSEEGVVLATIADVPGGRGGTPPVIPGKVGSTPGTLEYVIEFPNPGSPSNYIGVDSWGIIDLEANTQADGAGDDITEFVTPTRTPLGSKLKVLFTNNHASPAHLIVLRPKGTAIVQGDPVVVISEDAVSQAKYGKREFDFSSVWFTDPAIAKQHLDYSVAIYKDPPPRLTFKVKGSYDEVHLGQCIERDTGDRIRVVASGDFYGLFIDREFIVDSLAYVVKESREVEMTIACTVAPVLQLAATAAPYSPKVIPEVTPGTVEVLYPPDHIQAVAIAAGLKIISAGVARKYNIDVDQAEFRAKYIAPGDPLPEYVDLRLASEGGSFSNNGTTQLVITGIDADALGAQYVFTSAAAGRWFFAWRIHNGDGWSNWSDGNSVPTRVVHSVETTIDTTQDSGPPSGWGVTLSNGPVPNTVVVKATRPTNNGRLLRGWAVQVKDASTGSWRSLDEAAGAAVTRYDGSVVSFTLSNAGKRLTMDSGSGFGTATVGDLILLDVRGSNFDIAHCQHRIVRAFEGDDPATATWVEVDTPFEPQTLLSLNLKIVKATWTWASEGYLGGEANRGWLDSSSPGAASIAGDSTTKEFVSPPIEIPSMVMNPEARVFFTNNYSTSDNSVTHSTGKGETPGVEPPTTYADLSDDNVWIPVAGNRIHSDGTPIVSVTRSGGMVSFAGLRAYNGSEFQPGGDNLIGQVSRCLLFPDPNDQSLEVEAEYDQFNWAADLSGTSSHEWGPIVLLFSPGGWLYPQNYNALGVGFYLHKASGKVSVNIPCLTTGTGGIGNALALGTTWDLIPPANTNLTIKIRFERQNDGAAASAAGIALKTVGIRSSDPRLWVDQQDNAMQVQTWSATRPRMTGVQMNGCRVFAGIIQDNNTNQGSCRLKSVRIVSGRMHRLDGAGLQIAGGGGSSPSPIRIWSVSSR